MDIYIPKFDTQGHMHYEESRMSDQKDDGVDNENHIREIYDNLMFLKGKQDALYFKGEKLSEDEKMEMISLEIEFNRLYNDHLNPNF